MSSEVKNVSYNLFPLSTVLTVLFVLLKVFGKVTWSWWIVFAPLWVPTVIGLGVVGIVLVIALLVAITKSL